MKSKHTTSLNSYKKIYFHIISTIQSNLKTLKGKKRLQKVTNCKVTNKIFESKE